MHLHDKTVSVRHTVKLGNGVKNVSAMYCNRQASIENRIQGGMLMHLQWKGGTPTLAWSEGGPALKTGAGEACQCTCKMDWTHVHSQAWEQHPGP